MTLQQLLCNSFQLFLSSLPTSWFCSCKRLESIPAVDRLADEPLAYPHFEQLFASSQDCETGLRHKFQSILNGSAGQRSNGLVGGGTSVTIIVPTGFTRTSARALLPKL